MREYIYKLPVCNPLAKEFFVVFSRFEFALKAATYITESGNNAEPDWNGFARNFSEEFSANKNELLEKAINYLLTNPPKKQITTNRQLKWKNSPPDANLPELEQVLLMVRRVRNNLMHGGKYQNGCEPETARDNDLIERCLCVLEECLKLDDEVRYLFFNE